jgi:hypothetical protein
MGGFLFYRTHGTPLLWPKAVPLPLITICHGRILTHPLQ